MAERIAVKVHVVRESRAGRGAVVLSAEILVDSDQIAGDAVRAVLEQSAVALPYEGFDTSSRWASVVALLRSGHDASSYSSRSDEAAVDFTLAHDGSTVLRLGRETGRSRETFAQIDRLVELGLLDGDPRQYVVRYVGGSGGGGSFIDLATWLLDHAVDLGLGAIGGQYWRVYVSPWVRYARNGILDREARRIAVAWGHRGFVAPSVLREFVDRAPSWSVSELGERLTIHPRTTRQLLRALGYEKSGLGIWQSGTSRRSKKRRQRWLSDEDSGWFGSNESDTGYKP